MEMGVTEATNYIYYICPRRPWSSPSSSWGASKTPASALPFSALREDEIASEAMGIDLTQGEALRPSRSAPAGPDSPGCMLGGASTTFINPRQLHLSWNRPWSCPWWCSAAWVPCCGVTIAAAILVLTLAPEYLRAFSEYRMLLFGALMVHHDDLPSSGPHFRSRNAPIKITNKESRSGQLGEVGFRRCGCIDEEASA